MELPRLCLMNQQGLGKKGKSINFISLLRVALGFRQPQSMNPVNKYLPGKYNARLSFYYYRSWGATSFDSFSPRSVWAHLRSRRISPRRLYWRVWSRIYGVSRRALLPPLPPPPFSVQLIAKCANFIRNKPAGSRPGSKLISADVLLQQHQLFPVLTLV